MRVEDKRLINCTTVDVNQLMPLKYHWAWQHYLNGCANHWMPTEISMAKDIEMWKSDRISKVERKVVMRNLGFFSTAESLVANNICLAIYKFITNAECRQYLLRQSFEEAVHSHMFHYIVESLNLDEKEIFNMYREIPSIHKKDLFEMELTEALVNPYFTTATLEGKQKFVENLVGFYLIMEGIFLYSGFAMNLSLSRQGKMVGIGEQYQYVMRDESIHVDFGIDVINGIKKENPEIWTPAFQCYLEELIMQAVELEANYARDCIGQEILGLSSPMFVEYVQYMANRRLKRIGLRERYHRARNPFPWMSEVIDLGKEKNFFETRVTEYQSASALDWDE